MKALGCKTVAHFALRKSGGKIMDVPLEAPPCGIATQAVYAGVISSFLYGHLAPER